MAIREHVDMNLTNKTAMIKSAANRDDVCDCREKPSNNNNNDVDSELQMQLKCAEVNNCILQNNMNILKAAATQLAVQLDLANNRLTLYEEMSQPRASGIKQNSLQGADVQTSKTSSVSEYEQRISDLHTVVRQKDEMIMAIRLEMVTQRADEEKLLRSSLLEKDKVILHLMREIEELRLLTKAGRRLPFR